ncbi:MAG: SPOR domain-containing protein [Bacteroidales bacterium]|nr:SPOR domain-containing protein [Bacteroidales bacterium]
MNRALILLFVLSFCRLAHAQEGLVRQVVPQDSLVMEMPAAVDSTLLGTTIFSLINRNGGDVEINQSASMERAFVKYVENNAKKKLNGYRIRIFFDNKQSARANSEEVEKSFTESFPQYPVYRTYSNPYFKVAVGDFRTKSDAAKVLEKVLPFFPKAFIIKDVINYPL